MIDVVILAGGEIPSELDGHTEATERALIEVGGISTLHRLLNTLQDARMFKQVYVVSTPQALASLPPTVKGIPEGKDLVETLLKGIEAAQTDQVLVIAGDCPLVSAGTWVEFINKARERRLEAAYPIVSEANVLKTFPQGERTYAPLKDGKFTGGNAFFLPRERVPKIRSLIDLAYNARKHPLKLASMLGPWFIFSALTGRLTVARVEAKISSILGCRCGAVPMEDATISFDMDKASDLEAAEQYLQQHPSHS